MITVCYCYYYSYYFHCCHRRQSLGSAYQYSMLTLLGPASLVASEVLLGGHFVLLACMTHDT